MRVCFQDGSLDPLLPRDPADSIQGPPQLPPKASSKGEGKADLSLKAAGTWHYQIETIKFREVKNLCPRGM